MKSIEDYKMEEAIREQSDSDRKVSDDKYAAKIIERIVLGFLSVFALGVLGFLGDIIIKAIYHLPQ